MKNLNSEKIKELKEQKKEMEKEIAALNENGAGSKIKSIIIFLTIIILFLGVLAGMVKADVGGFGSGILAPIIGNVSGLNKILPNKSVASTASDNTPAKTNTNDTTAGLSSGTDASSANTKSTANTQSTADTSQVVANATGVSNTKTSASSQKAVTAKKSSASQAAQAASRTANTTDAQAAKEAKLADYVDTYSKMNAKNAASILGNMTGDLPLVAKILMNMRASKRADIMANLDVNIASKLTLLMSNQQ